MKKLLLLAFVALPVFAADVCDTRGFEGSYGFQLSGETRISSDGKPKPTAAIGSLVFDGHGVVSGYTSAQYAGYLQGNPTNGKYEAHTDCSISWSLQDDSGAFQHFSGKMTPDGTRIEFRQTDPGGPPRGIMVRTAASCSPAAVSQSYRVSMSGSFTPMLEGEEPYRVAASGTAMTAGGKMSFDFSTGTPADGTVEVDSACVVTVEIGGSQPMKLRGYLVDDGKEILAIQTDPGFTVTARFTVR
jgi:hypothetical protein